MNGDSSQRPGFGFSRPLTVAFGALVTAEFLWPSEAAMHGEGLHLALLWLLLAGLTALAGGRAADSRNMRMAQVAVGLILGGVWLSTWHVFHVHGDRRAALNLAFQWSSIAAAWWLTTVVAANVSHTLVMTLLIAIGLGAAVQGSSQYHITNRDQADWYQSLRAELDDAIAMGPRGRMRRSAIEAQFRASQIPLEGPGRKLFEHRLLHSIEPVGPFALANSLAGLLAVSVVLLMGALLSLVLHGSRQRFSIVSTVGMMLVLGYCLMLTKSRAAWLAGIVGLTFLVLQLRSSELLRRLWKFGMGITVATLMLGIVGAATGALDKEVVLESSRSVRFRLLYWMGAAGVISDHPIVGAGPGNFRQVYLVHKPDESSEEILDPHNIVFDMWATAGLAGLAGLLLFLWCVRSGHQSRDLPPDQQSSPAATIPRSRIVLSIVLGGFLHLAWNWIQGVDFSIAEGSSVVSWLNGVWIIPLVGAGAATVIPVSMPSFPVLRAAFATLFLHLLAAGGLQISGVVLIFMLLNAATVSARPELSSRRADHSPGNRIFGGAVLVFAVVLLFFGLHPVRQVGHLRGLAAQYQAIGDVAQAEKTLRLAIEEDPLNVESCQQLADLLTYDFVRKGARPAQTSANSDRLPAELEQTFSKAMNAISRFIACDRRNAAGYHFRSQLLHQRLRLQWDDKLAKDRIQDLQQAIAFYPGNVLFWTELALARNRRNQDDAVAAAERALELDEMNHKWGHQDRYLSETMATQMKLLVEEQSNR